MGFAHIMLPFSNAAAILKLQHNTELLVEMHMQQESLMRNTSTQLDYPLLFGQRVVCPRPSRINDILIPTISEVVQRHFYLRFDLNSALVPFC